MVYKFITGDEADRLANEEKVLWAVAYDINNDTLHVNLKQTPVKGRIIKTSRYRWSFAAMNKNGELRKSGHVHFRSRMYTDTYEEAVNLYNSLVQERIDLLKAYTEKAKEDFLLPEDL